MPGRHSGAAWAGDHNQDLAVRCVGHLANGGSVALEVLAEEAGCCSVSSGRGCKGRSCWFDNCGGDPGGVTPVIAGSF